MKRILCFVGLIALAVSAFADGTNVNMSAGYIRMPSRNSVTNNVDAVFFNPAGTTELEKGFNFSVSNQFMYKDYSFTKGSYLPSPVPNSPMTSMTSDGEDKDWGFLFPTAYIDYTAEKWSAFGAFYVAGGGGSLAYDPYASLILNPVPMVKSDVSIDGTSYLLSYLVGAAVKPVDFISFSAAFKILQGNNKMTVKASPADVMGFPGMDEEVKTSAVGFGGVFGVNITPMKGLNIAAKYEMPIKMEYEDKDGGNKSRNDGTAFLTMGLGYRPNDKLWIDADFNYYFDEETAKHTADPYDDKRENSWSVGLGAEYKLSKKIALSIGTVYTDSGATEESNTVAYPFNGTSVTLPGYNPALDSILFGVGAELELLKDFNLELGFLPTFYLDKKDSNSVDSQVTYSKMIYIFGLGLNYHF